MKLFDKATDFPKETLPYIPLILIMLTENRKYNFVGELTLNRSLVLDDLCQPKDDVVNWSFLLIEERLFSFVYKINNPLEAKYGEPFRADLAFTMIEVLKDNLELNRKYQVFRGQENVGTLRLIAFIE